jgi:hypothetical protein
MIEPRLEFNVSDLPTHTRLLMASSGMTRVVSRAPIDESGACLVRTRPHELH